MAKSQCRLLIQVNHALVTIFNVANISLNSIHENKILAKISEFTVFNSTRWSNYRMVPEVDFNSLPPGNFFMLFCFLLIFFKFNFFEKFFQEYYQSVKQFGSRSDPTFCRAWSGSKLFAKVISRWHLKGKEFKIGCHMHAGLNHCITYVDLTVNYFLSL